MRLNRTINHNHLTNKHLTHSHQFFYLQSTNCHPSRVGLPPAQVRQFE